MPNEAGSAVGIGGGEGSLRAPVHGSSTTPENSMSMIALPTEMWLLSAAIQRGPSR